MQERYLDEMDFHIDLPDIVFAEMTDFYDFNFYICTLVYGYCNLEEIKL